MQGVAIKPAERKGSFFLPLAEVELDQGRLGVALLCDCASRNDRERRRATFGAYVGTLSTQGADSLSRACAALDAHLYPGLIFFAPIGAG